jgi:hypothetical protein
LSHYFPLNDSLNYSARGIQKIVRRVANRAGITQKVSPHVLRPFASHFIMKTGNLPALQKLLGHASPMMTQRYAHLSSGYLQAEMRAFNSCMPITQESAPKTVPMDTYMDTCDKTTPLKNSIIPMDSPP